ncbi:conserved hypothetical protein [anaerobic digester metagenome]|jgi:hypothetical protein|uniref:Uncharacterized protein n=1 Tax=anaerobic digester metagenome TaxID=1263854 RepID=A0A485M3X7_9ZZZZ|nr:DUF5752 family protein [Deltaproteobacteria bacterium]
MAEPFAVRDCALIAIATGQYAYTLAELRDRLEIIPLSCIYYHFWGGLLRPKFDNPEYQNDFAIWVYHGLRDKPLAERMSLIDPSKYHDLEDLRSELIDILEERIDESELLPWMKANQRFYFVRSQTVVFDTRVRLDTPELLGEHIPHMSLGSVFYHFIDARRRPPWGRDDFTHWVSGFGDDYAELAEQISQIDPYFTSLVELRDELTRVFAAHTPGGGA